jgi:hypothetical protein
VHGAAHHCSQRHAAVSIRPILNTLSCYVCCRLCDPYVTWQLIQEEFGDLAAEVASKYFEENAAARRYVFRAPYSRFVWCGKPMAS